MKGTVLFAGLALLTAAALAGCRPSAAPVSISTRPASINDRSTTNVSEKPSKPLAEMSWKDASESVQTVGSLKGKAVILDFWATNCPPCREEIPHLNSLVAKYGPDRLAVYGLHVGDQIDRAEIPKFTAETKIDYPIGFPEDALTSFVFANNDAIPQTLVIDRNGQIVTKVVGFSDRIRADLDTAVETALSAK